MTRAFPIEVIISVTTDILLCNFSEVHEFMEYMVGGPILNISLPRAAPMVAESILSQHPELSAIKFSTMKSGKVPAVVAQLRRDYGDTIEVAPC